VLLIYFLPPTHSTVSDDQVFAKPRMVMKMLRWTVLQGSSLADNDHDMYTFMARCVAVRHRLETVVRTKTLEISKTFDLCHTYSTLTCRHWKLNPSNERRRPTLVESLVQRQVETRKNIGQLPVLRLMKTHSPLPKLLTWREVVQWIQILVSSTTKANKLYSQLLGMHTIEAFVFHQAKQIIASTSGDTSNSTLRSFYSSQMIADIVLEKRCCVMYFPHDHVVIREGVPPIGGGGDLIPKTVVGPTLKEIACVRDWKPFILFKYL